MPLSHLEQISEPCRRLIGLMQTSLEKKPQPHFHPASFVANENGDQALTALAIQHGVLPWLVRHMPAIGAYLSPETAAHWQNLDAQNRFRSFLNSSWTIRLVIVLQKAGIPCLPIKGISAAIRHYGGIDGRACGDLDIMVPAEHVPEACSILASLGMKPKFPSRPLNSAEARWVSRSMHHYTFIEPGTGLMIELHWALHDNSLLDHQDREWPRLASEKIVIDGFEIPALDRPRDYLLLLSHAARSGWAKMKWLLDLQQAWSTLSISDREEVEARIKEFRLQPAQKMFLSLANFLFGAEPLDPDRDAPPQTLLMFDSSSRNSLGRKYRHVKNIFIIRDGATYRWSTVRLYLRSWSDMHLLNLPSWAFALYVPLRGPLLVYRSLKGMHRDA